MNPNQTQVVKTIEKSVEHPVTGAMVTRKATIVLPVVPADFDGIKEMFGGNAEALARAVTLAVNGRLSSLYNARLKGGDVIAALTKVRKNLVKAGLDEETAIAMIRSNPALSQNLSLADLTAEYGNSDIEALFASDKAPATEADTEDDDGE